MRGANLSIQRVLSQSAVGTRKTERRQRPVDRWRRLRRLRRASASGEAQCARTRDDTQVSISDCSQATDRVDSLIGTGNWFCEMSL